MKIFIPADKNFKGNFIPIPQKIKSSKKTIIVYLKKQFFGAYQNGKLIHWGPISSGKNKCLDIKTGQPYSCQTPTGVYKVLWKTKFRMSKKYKSKMPWAIAFDNRGYFIHQGKLPGKADSRGCVRVLREDARWLYYWVNKNTKIIIKNI